jgi:hypothetical protein
VQKIESQWAHIHYNVAKEQQEAAYQQLLAEVKVLNLQLLINNNMSCFFNQGLIAESIQQFMRIICRNIVLVFLSLCANCGTFNIYLEIELSHVDEAFEKLDWIGEEVTEDIRYYNNQLAKQAYTSW